MPVIAIRQAGFSMELLSPLSDLDSYLEAEKLLSEQQKLREQLKFLKSQVRTVTHPSRDSVTNALGTWQPLSGSALKDLEEQSWADVREALRYYHGVVTALIARWSNFEMRLAAQMVEAKRHVVEQFKGNEDLRAVLLLSNDANYDSFSNWLDRFEEPTGEHFKRMADLLALYLQRVTTKNDTHSHFGPINFGRVDHSLLGISWSRCADLSRRSYSSHWAAEQVAKTLSNVEELKNFIRPRRRPLAFYDRGQVDLYSFTTSDGLMADWHFAPTASMKVGDCEKWLWDQCDGKATVGELRKSWSAHWRGQAPMEGKFDELLTTLAEKGFLVSQFEISAGVHHPLDDLILQLGSDGAAAAKLPIDAAKRLNDAIKSFSRAQLDQREHLLAEIKSEFRKFTGCEPNRNAGLQQADRSVLFEEAHGVLSDLRIGKDVSQFICSELAPAFELTLAKPRLRMKLEREILTEWFIGRFGNAEKVGLHQFYTAFFEERKRLRERTSSVEARLLDFDRKMTDMLLASGSSSAPEIVVSETNLSQFIAALPKSPAALCNPDILLAAKTREDITKGDFIAVVGECHAIREVLSHTSFSKMIEERVPEFAREVISAYRGLLDTDEYLVEVIRGHPDKTACQLQLPVFDLEVFGKSPKAREHVLQPHQLYLSISKGELQLRAYGMDGRARLLAPPAGGPSIHDDPLSIFAFPRNFSGINLEASHLDHVPRIRANRVILHRRTWRVEREKLKGITFRGDTINRGDAAEFLSGRKLSAELGMPRHVFAKIPGEPKPIYVDWASPLLVRQLFRLAREASGRIEFSEMLPGPTHLWLDIADHRYTSELRCAVFNTAGAK